MKNYEWAIVGSGIAGVAIAEILSRQGHSVVLIEKNEKLASETTREFHEWLHTGALYTLIPDKLKTLRFILGAIDDLIEFYSSFDNMNIVPTNSGLKLNNSQNAWFDENYINFKYRIKGRRITFPWIYGAARSMYLIERIHEHDWLRRRAGELAPFKVGRARRISQIMKNLFLSKKYFETVETPDFTINSRSLLRDLIGSATQNGLEISLNNKIEKIEKIENYKIVKGASESFKVEKIAICGGAGIKYFSDVKTKTSYAPIAVVSGVSATSKSFVELDYFPKKCINLLTKGEGFGLVGGISLSDKNKCDEYLDYVVKKHQKLDPSIKEMSRYIGKKTEITFKDQPRGYLYHIVNQEDGVWTIVPGKFTLAFSMAPEFYRRVYQKNPKKYFNNLYSNNNSEDVSNTVWMDILNKTKEKNGTN